MVNVHPKAAHCVAREAQVTGATIDGQSTAIAQHAVRDGRTRGRQGVRYSSRVTSRLALCKYQGLPLQCASGLDELCTCAKVHTPCSMHAVQRHSTCSCTPGRSSFVVLLVCVHRTVP